MVKYSSSALASLLVSLALLSASCSGQSEATEPGKVAAHNDFESVLGWGGNTDASISTEQAHSGNHSVRVGPQHEFGLTYIQSLGKMTLAKAKAVTISGWVWVPGPKNPATLVLEITHSAERNTPVFYGSLPVASAAGTRSWQHVSQTLQLPDSVQVTNQVKFYLWSSGSPENVYADDLSLSVSN